MKNDTDALFEKLELPQRGFQAKRKMAADKLQEPPIDFVLAYGDIFAAQRAALEEASAQPAQEPVAWTPIEQLKSVLCGPDGKCCIAGSDEDRAIVDRALQALVEANPDLPTWPKRNFFAGVTVWIGDATVTQIVPEMHIRHEIEPGTSITYAAQKCLDMLAAYIIKEKST